MQLSRRLDGWAVKIVNSVLPEEKPFFCGHLFWGWRFSNPLPPYMTGMTVAIFKTRKEARTHAQTLGNRVHARVVKVAVEIREIP